MRIETLKAFVTDHFAGHHGAKPCTDYGHWQAIHTSADQPLAALAYRSAGDERLFLEGYLELPIETLVSQVFGRTIERDTIVEIGCLAAAPTPALYRLWQEAARDLALRYDIAVATLTLPLRRMFARVGLPFVELASADPSRLSADMRHQWGRYYDSQPLLCAGEIGTGFSALAAFGGEEAR